MSNGGFDHGVIDLVSYDCEARVAVINVTNAPAFIALYGWDKSSGAPTTKNIPPCDSKVIAGVSGMNISVSGVPHENNSCDIQLQIWGVDLHVDTGFECCSSGGSPGSVESGGGSASVLP